jgi:Flp pilus assembly protein TadG
VAPIFLLFVFGMIEYGRMVMVQQILTNASREGARVAVLEGSTRNDVVEWVVDYCAASRIAVMDDNVSVPRDPETASDGDPVTVTVGVAYRDVSWLPSPLYLGD